jgi:hypothetical protein
MKGEVIIDAKGEITSSLTIGNEELHEIGDLITNILQDINTYMRMNH